MAELSPELKAEIDRVNNELQNTLNDKVALIELEKKIIVIEKRLATIDGLLERIKFKIGIM